MLSNYLLSQLTVHVCFPALLEINLTYSSLLHDHHYRTIKASASILFPKAIWCYVQTFKLIMIIIIIMISNYHQCSKKMSLNFLRLLTCLQNLCQNPGFRILNVYGSVCWIFSGKRSRVPKASINNTLLYFIRQSVSLFFFW